MTHPAMVSLAIMEQMEQLGPLTKQIIFCLDFDDSSKANRLYVCLHFKMKNNIKNN